MEKVILRPKRNRYGAKERTPNFVPAAFDPHAIKGQGSDLMLKLENNKIVMTPTTTTTPLTEVSWKVKGFGRERERDGLRESMLELGGRMKDVGLGGSATGRGTVTVPLAGSYQLGKKPVLVDSGGAEMIQNGGTDKRERENFGARRARFEGGAVTPSFPSPRASRAPRVPPSIPSLPPILPSPAESYTQEICHKCLEPLGFNVNCVELLNDGKMFHQDCLRCQGCRGILGGGKYAEREGKIWHLPVSPSLSFALMNGVLEGGGTNAGLMIVRAED